MSIAIYTAIFGNYDDLKPLPKMPGVDAFCFTDNPNIEADGWKTIVWNFATPPTHPRMRAKWFRMYPNECLPEYRYTIWIDASFQVTDPFFAGWMMKYLGDNDLALFRHPDRNNIKDEVEASRVMHKYAGHDMSSQIAHYRNLGYQDECGLFATGVLVRDYGNQRMVELGNSWWVENNAWTYQDQLSLPFLLWQMGITPNIIPGNIYLNEWLRWIPHQSAS